MLNELDILQALKHPSIIDLYGIYEVDENVYLVLDYLKGGSLLEKIHKKENYCEGDAAKIIKKLLEVLGFCQERNVIHRDLKPANIIFM